MSAPLAAQVWLSDPVTVSLVALAGTLLTALGAIVVAWVNQRSNRRIEQVSQRVEHQLTQNGGKNTPQTVPDRFHSLLAVIQQQSDEQAAFRAEIREQVAEMKADARETRHDVREIKTRVGDLEHRRRWPL